MDTKKISVVIPMYNACATIEACIQSIISTGYASLEIVVVDDCSQDDCRDIVNRAISRYPDMIKLILLDKNGGPAIARNRGAEKADGDYIFFVDSDTEMVDDTLHNFARDIEQSEADALSGIYHWQPLNRGAAPLYKALLNYFTCSRHGIFENEIFNGADAGVRADVYREVGGFNENLEWGMDYENEELGQRIAASFKIKLDPNIQVRHHFDGFGKMSGLYFHRVSLWAEMFIKRKKFESNALGSAPSGISTLSNPLFLVFFIAAVFWNPWFFIPASLFFCLYMYWYLGFFIFVIRKRPFFLPVAVVLNFWFCAVLSAGAAYGALRSMLGAERVAWTSPGASS